MSGIRVTQSTISRNSIHNLQSSLSKLSRLQEQQSSGKLITKPSDDPSGAVDSLRYRSEQRRNLQYSRNAIDAKGWLGTADTTLTDSLDYVRRARDLVVQGATGTIGAQERQALATEVENIRTALIGISNTAYLGRPIFAGNANPSASGLPTYDSAGTYNGDAGAVMRTVGSGDEKVQVNVTGPELFGSGSSSLFAVLQTIVDHLRGSSVSDVNALGSTDITALDNARNVVQNKLAEVGSRENSVDITAQRQSDNDIHIATNLSDIEDIDLAKTIMDLQLQQTAYQASLKATASVIQPSLMDFLK